MSRLGFSCYPGCFLAIGGDVVACNQGDYGLTLLAPEWDRGNLARGILVSVG
jgi:hypothetical protein